MLLRGCLFFLLFSCSLNLLSSAKLPHSEQEIRSSAQKKFQKWFDKHFPALWAGYSRSPKHHEYISKRTSIGIIKKRININRLLVLSIQSHGNYSVEILESLQQAFFSLPGQEKFGDIRSPEKRALSFRRSLVFLVGLLHPHEIAALKKLLILDLKIILRRIEREKKNKHKNLIPREREIITTCHVRPLTCRQPIKIAQ